MSASLHVLLEGRRAGLLTRLSGGRLRFRYDEDYRGVPLSVSMPVGIGEHTDRAIAPWIAGLLPDDEAVIARWSRQFQTAPTPFALLGSPIGEDCAGAVQLVRPERLEELLARRGGITWLSETDVAGRLRLLRRDATAWLGSGAGPGGRFSLAGAQAKIALFFDGRRWGAPSGERPTTHILKPAVRGFDDHDLNEHLCLTAARRAGLVAARTAIMRFDDQSAVVVERYDRIEREGRLHRVHQEDLCQALSVPPTRKYQNEGGPGPRRIIDLLRTVMAPSHAEQDIGRFIDALIWNWLVAGTDAHAKNYSLLLSADQVRLAPLYDMASALPYPWHERELRFAMKLGRDYRVHPHHDPWPGAAKAWGLDAAPLRDRVLELAARAAEAFADAASDPSVSELASRLPGRLIDLVAERVRRCQRAMEAPRLS
jgi:serine/threonine-protein kinase HipA